MAKITAGAELTVEPAASDVFPIVDISEPADADKRKKIKWSTIKTVLTSVFDALYAAIGHDHAATYAPIAEGVTNGNTHNHSGGDGGQIAYSSLSGIPKIVDIGDWNMYANETVAVAHGLTLSKIRSVSVLIRNDADSVYYQIPGVQTAYTQVDLIISYINGTNVYLGRAGSGLFDSTDFNATSYNRGWIVIDYTD
jgi:hypothetical protein